MATFVFDGTADVSVANFNPLTDTLIVDGIEFPDVASFARTSSSFVISLDSGFSVSLSGALDGLTNDNFAIVGAAVEPIVFAIGDSSSNPGLVGNLGSGGFGSDTITASLDGAIIYGNQDNDTIDGGGLENLFLFGGAGSDDIDGVGAGSVVYGGLGGDSVNVVAGANESVTVYGGNGSSDSADGADHIDGGESDDLIYANAGNDTVHGYGGDDMIFGGMGDDTLGGDYGGGGDDSVYGNIGDDYLFSESGSDLLFGGQGNDYLEADDNGGSVNDEVLLSGGLGQDTIDAFDSASENVTIYGGNGASDDTDGGDTIYGSLQGDLIYANAGDDTIFGDQGDDTIFGGLGNDTINADVGLNVVTGGAGDDTFVSTLNSDGSDNYSVVTDFTDGTDLLDFNSDLSGGVTTEITDAAIDFDTYQDVYNVYGVAMTANSALVVVVSSGDLAGTTFVIGEFDANPGLEADEVIALTGFTGTITADDFVV